MLCAFYNKKKGSKSSREYFKTFEGTWLKDVHFTVKLEDNHFKVRELWKSDDPPPGGINLPPIPNHKVQLKRPMLIFKNMNMLCDYDS